MNNGAKIRELISKIDKKLNERETYNFYGIINYIVIGMEEKYNLQEEEIIKQLEMILKGLEYYD